jgi:hypothetical protein
VSLKNHSLPGSVSIVSSLLASKLVGPVGRSQVIGIDLGFAPRAFRMGVSCSRATFENHSLPSSVSVASSPLASKLVGPVGRSQVIEIAGELGLQALRMRVSFQSSITQESLASQQCFGCQFTAGFQHWLGQSVVCSRAIGIAGEFGPRAFRRAVSLQMPPEGPRHSQRRSPGVS